MSELQNSAGSNEAPERKVSRDGITTAPGRCVMYAVFSDVAASPFDAEPAIAGEAIDIAGLGLPYALNDFEPLLQRWRAADKDQLPLAIKDPQVGVGPSETVGVVDIEG